MIDDPYSSAISGQARVVLMPIGRAGEQVAIAVVGRAADGESFARAITKRIVRSLPNDLGPACFNFGHIVATDFLLRKPLENWLDWQPPLVGLLQTEPYDLEAADVAGLAAAAARICAFEEDRQTSASDPVKSPPRANEETRFLESVRAAVLAHRPNLKDGFKRSFSLSGSAATSEVDFVGGAYATCYAAINPKTKRASRLTHASAALWRLARARDAFGFASPSIIELTAWVPPEGMPIYSNNDYDLIRETVAELSEQARRADLSVHPAHDAIQAANRLLEVEAVRN